MHEQYEIFDAASLTLTRGINLVEASAGTGKTYSIIMLVLRALVELDIPIEKILIVTFTKAATEELKSRIRERLVEVRDLLEARNGAIHSVQDGTMSDWLSALKDRNTALRKIQLALYDLDRAGIFTIHGFCQRMLTEQALESGQLFEVEMISTMDQIHQQVAEDFWRNHIYSLPGLSCAVITSRFPSPQSLLASVAACLGGNSSIEPLFDALEGQATDQALSQSIAALSDWWIARNTELFSLFAQAIEEGYFKKRGIAENYTGMFADTQRFLAGDYAAYPEQLLLFSRKYLVNELNGTKLRGAEKKQEFLAHWPLADERVELFVDLVEKLCLFLRVHLATEIRKGVQSRLDLQGKMGFDDLIIRLSRSLEGGNGSYLKRAIGSRFSIALIDEFQDTDAEQYHIFSSLFGTAKHYLYLIGDPKQAIYKFRGADIYSYFQARGKADRYLTLNRNYRSHPYPIEEINRLFSSTKDPFWFPEEVLSYRKILPAKKKGEIDLYRNNRSLAGVKYCQLPLNQESSNGRWTSATATQFFIAFVVSEIVSLLDRDKPVTLVNGDSEELLNPKDIAVLVRSNKQAELYRSALVSAGVPAVVASKHSVYDTRECRDLCLLLQAIMHPGDNSRLRTAMTIPWFGYNGDQLYQIWLDDEKITSWHERFSHYNQLWLERGILLMMHRLLSEENVYPNLARRPFAERAIANISQLMELVQEKENSENLGTGQLLQWLQVMKQDGGEGDDDELLLESDEDAVQLVTMHGAKGLEYPVVFCPYLWYRSNRLNQEKFQIKCFDQKLHVVVDLGSELFERRKQQALEEEIAEDLRLLYVAMTRAKVLCYAMWADIRGSGWVADSFQSALGYLLFSNESFTYSEQVEALVKTASKESASYELISLNKDSRRRSRMQSHGEFTAMQPSARTLTTEWQMSSFSGLATLSEYGLEQHYLSEWKGTGTMIPLQQLPAGPQFGNLIHDLLEENNFSEIADNGGLTALHATVEEKCSRHGLVCEARDVCSLLRNIVSTPLRIFSNGTTFSLTDVGDENCLKEVNFYYHLNEFISHKINDIFKNEKTYVPLAHKVMKGYLTGFIDLICQFDNKYYIIDYKTNYLGDRMEDYGPNQLAEAMVLHNYGLQYWIYTLVMHQHLTNLFENYSYDSSFGGVIYLFARGMSPDFPEYGVFKTVPDYNLLVKLEEVLRNGQE